MLPALPAFDIKLLVVGHDVKVDLTQLKDSWNHCHDPPFK